MYIHIYINKEPGKKTAEKESFAKEI